MTFLGDIGEEALDEVHPAMRSMRRFSAATTTLRER
jgi:hypothetical protein